jgi:hypothetical protein
MARNDLPLSPSEVISGVIGDDLFHYHTVL